MTVCCINKDNRQSFIFRKVKYLQSQTVASIGFVKPQAAKPDGKAEWGHPFDPVEKIFERKYL